MEYLIRKLKTIVTQLELFTEKQKTEFTKLHNPDIITQNLNQLSNIIGAVKNANPDAEDTSKSQDRIK